MQYQEKQKLSKEMILRLRGLKTGKMIDNNNIKNSAEYSFEIILYAFKVCKAKILSAIQTKTFKNEMAKFVYIVVIVENNLNDVYIRITNAKKSQEKTEKLDTKNLSHDGAEYKTVEIKVDEELKKLW